MATKKKPAAKKKAETKKTPVKAAAPRQSQRGKKYSPEIKERAIQLFATNGNLTDTAKALNVPKTTVKGWLDSPEYIEQVEQVRTEKRIEFAEKAGDIINKGLELLDRRITTALDHETALDELLDGVARDTELKGPTREALIAKIKGLQLQKVSEITTAVGTLYDKRALAQGESTNNTSLTITDADRALLEKVGKRLT